MDMNDRYRALIADEFRNCVNRTIQRIAHNERTYRPFHSALLSEEVIFWSAFERSFSTSFGQRVIEELARLAALSNGADQAARQVEAIEFLIARGEDEEEDGETKAIWRARLEHKTESAAYLAKLLGVSKSKVIRRLEKAIEKATQKGM